jgi:hypothetical protein
MECHWGAQGDVLQCTYHHPVARASYLGVALRVCVAAAVLRLGSHQLTHMPAPVPVLVIASVLAVLAWLSSGRVVRERLTAFRGVGVQLTTDYAWGASAQKFLCSEDIQAVVINEGITMHRVVYYLAFLLRDDPRRLILAFPHGFPAYKLLQPVYQNLDAMLR